MGNKLTSAASEPTAAVTWDTRLTLTRRKRIPAAPLSFPSFRSTGAPVGSGAAATLSWPIREQLRV